MNPQSQIPLPQDPLAQLRDIHLPQSVSWWPPAPGWWLLALLLLVGLAIAARWLWLRYQRSAYRRTGAAELEQLFASWQNSADTSAFLQQLNALLKRIALYSFPGADVASMNGTRWTDFLDRQWPGDPGNRADNCFSGGPLEFGPYAAKPGGIDVAALHRSSLRWLREHRDQQRA